MSTKLELLKVETDTTKVYKPSDSFLFKLTFNNQVALDEDVEFEITYFGDAYSEDHDQRICHNVIGPLQAGKLYFELETSPIDLTKIPIKTLFGLTTILIAGKFKGEQFVRIGYVVNVRYPGIDAEKLLDGDEVPIDGQEEEMDGDEGYEECDDGDEECDDDDMEVMDDEDMEAMDDEGSEDDEAASDNDEPCCENESCDCDDEPCCDKDDCDCDQEHNSNLEDALAAALMPKSSRKPIPLETPMLAGQDDFEYKEIPMKQSRIELTLLEKPIVHVFDIDWSNGASKDADNIAVSSENEGNVADEQEPKKPKTQ